MSAKSLHHQLDCAEYAEKRHGAHSDDSICRRGGDSFRDGPHSGEEFGYVLRSDIPAVRRKAYRPCKGRNLLSSGKAATSEKTRRNNRKAVCPRFVLSIEYKEDKEMKQVDSVQNIAEL